MPFLFPSDVTSTWLNLKATLPHEMASFGDYYERTWIGTSANHPRFVHDIWNQHEGVLAGLPRSSNIAEGWYNGFMSLMGCTKPTVWRFLDVLKKEQGRTEWKAGQKILCLPPKPREPKWIEFDNRLSDVIQAYDDYRTPSEFLVAAATLL